MDITKIKENLSKEVVKKSETVDDKINYCRQKMKESNDYFETLTTEEAIAKFIDGKDMPVGILNPLQTLQCSLKRIMKKLRE